MTAGGRSQVHFDDEIVLWGDTYYYRGTPDSIGRRIERSLDVKKGAAQKDVLRAKKNFLDGISNLGRSSTDNGRNSFESIAKKYLAYRLLEKENSDPKQRISQATFYEAESLLKTHLIPWFGRTRIDEVDQPSFKEYCSGKNDLNLVNHRKVLNHFLKWCAHEEYVRRIVTVEIPKFARKSRRQREILSHEEITALLEAAEGKILLYISLYLLMGMRNMEICKLRWDEVDLNSAALRVNPMNNRKRKPRVIPINQFVLTLLKLTRVNSNSEWVFPSKISVGKSPHMDPSGGHRKAWLKALKDAKITRKITPHDLRATFETFMHTNKEFTDTQREKMAGAQIDVQKNTYVHMDADHLRGLEESVNVKGLRNIFMKKLGGNLGGKKQNNQAAKGITSGKKTKK